MRFYWALWLGMTINFYLFAQKQSSDTVSLPFSYFYIDYQPDKITIFTENNLWSLSASTDELLKFVPGMHILPGGILSYKGKRQFLLYVNYKQILLPDDEQIGAYLRNIPAFQVSKIEIRESPSAEFDAQGNACMLTVVMRQESSTPFHLSLYSNYSNGQQQKVMGGLRLSFQKSKWYHFIFQDHTQSNRMMNTQTFRQPYYLQKTTDDQTITNNIRFGTTFTPDNQNTYNLQFRGMYHRAFQDNQIFFRSDNIHHFQVNNFDDWRDIHARFYYRHDFKKINQYFIVDVTMGKYLLKNRYFAESPVFGILSHIVSTRLNTQTTQLTYNAPWRKWQTQTGIKFTHINFDNRTSFSNLDTTNTLILKNIPAQNHFIFTESINSLYTQAERKIGNISLKIGIRFENSVTLGRQSPQPLRTKQKHWGIFPHFLVTLPISKYQEISCSYGRRIDRFQYNKRNTLITATSPYTYQQGNDDLQPQMGHIFVLSHFYKQDLLVTSFHLNINRNIIYDVLENQDFHTIHHVQNANGFWVNRGVSISFNKRINSWWYTSAFVYGFKNIYTNNTSINSYDLRSFGGQLFQRIELGRNYSIELGCFYHTASSWLNEQYGQTWSVYAAFQKEFYHRKLSVRINTFDMLANRVFIKETALQTYQSIQMPSRLISFSVIYRFIKD